MYEFNGWAVLKVSAAEKPDGAIGRARIAEWTSRLSKYRWTGPHIDIIDLDEQVCLRAAGMLNRNRGESDDLHELFADIARELPGSYGLLYESYDEADLSEPPGEFAFRVLVLQKGMVSVRLDPFLSPTMPLLEN
jgi:hypothetical protein